MKDILFTAAVVAIAIVLLCLTIIVSGCASSGLYQMSDEWCSEHINASATRCAGR